MKKLFLFMLLLCSITPLYAMQERTDVVVIIEDEERRASPDYTRISPNAFWRDHPVQEASRAKIAAWYCCYLSYAGAITAYIIYELVIYHNQNS